MANFDSNFEEWVSNKLNISKNTTLKLNYTIEHTYTPDFVDDINKILYESKGYFDAEDRRKILAVKKSNPTWRIILVFQNPNNKISKKSKTTYAVWCEKNNIEWKQI